MKDISESFEILSETVIEFVEGLECSNDIESQLEAETIKAALMDTRKAIAAYKKIIQKIEALKLDES
jgi:hypothetical protein